MVVLRVLWGSAVSYERDTPVGSTLLSYRVTSLIRNNSSLGPYFRNMLRAPWWSHGSYGAVLLFMSEVPL